MALPEQSVRAPTPFGPYLLDAPIAEGGMARVYRARLRGALGFEKPLVVKQVRPELARDPRFVAMFAREAKTLVRLVHPHIVPIYELGVVDGVYFIAMEHIEGATLEGLLVEEALPPGAVAHLGVQVAGALQHAHERHALVHRDITPGNVMVDEGGHARLLDFGIATPAEGASGDVFGTPGYLSPEQARGDEVGPASDVFSLACVLVRAMTGEAAFPGEEGKARLLAGKRPSLADVPAPLAELLGAMLAAEPASRPSAAEVARRLRAWLAGAHPEGVAGEVAERVRSARERPVQVVTTGESTAAVGKVQTLATSPALDRVRPTETADGPGEATQPIEGRGPRSTTAARRLPNSDSDTDSDSDSDSDSPRERRWLLLAALSALGLLAVWALRPPSPPPDEPAPPAPSPVAVERPSEPAPPAPTIPEPPAPTAESEPAEPPSAGPARGTLRITATPWAEVSLDGRRLGSTPLRSVSAPGGRHRLHFECPPLGARADAEVQITPGAEVAVFADLQSDPPRVVTH